MPAATAPLETMMHSHPSRMSCATSAVRRANCFSSSALARGRVRIPEPNLRRMRLGFLYMRRLQKPENESAQKESLTIRNGGKLTAQATLEAFPSERIGALNECA